MDLPQVYSNHLHINKAITNLLNINMHLHHHYFTTKPAHKFMIRTTTVTITVKDSIQVAILLFPLQIKL
ncbi:hypothetical protein BG005_004898 [Podila minutissima]|nr:hypothetical protein BG005_004898 [Podila minutissima]